jgi:hypothetical protein
LSRNTKMTTVSARKSTGKKNKIRHMTIKPVENGFTTETAYEPPEGAKGEALWNPESETNVHESKEAMHAHVGKTFGVKMSPPPQPEGEGDKDEAED